MSALRAVLLRLLRIPPDPSPPPGSPDSVRVFRAARPFYYLRLLHWGLRQLLVLAGAIALLIAVRESGLPRPPQARLALDAQKTTFREAERPVMELVGFAFQWLELLTVAGLIAQMPFTFLAVRLDYELRWYIVTDRSLRVREGVWRVSEVTMTYANIQEITVQQGPLQRLLGLRDLRVRTAGGGQAATSGRRGRNEQDASHTAYFRGISQAREVRELILQRLRHQRDSGLGDPDEPGVPGSAPAVEAARELLGELRALRQAL